MHTCETCGKKFDSPYKLGGHIGSHKRDEVRYRARRRGEPESWNKCLHCGGTTKNQYYCSFEHMKLHTRSKPVRIYTDLYTDRKMISLDISRTELEEYRAQQTVCEICGRTESAVTYKKGSRPNQLTIDHCHTSHLFRGLLCSVCNRQLGWYERNKNQIKAYIAKPPYMRL